MDLSTVKSVEIVGDVVEVRRTVVEKRIATTDFVDMLLREAPMQTPILPKSCVMFAQSRKANATTSVFVVERMAGVHPFRYMLTDEEADLTQDEDEDDDDFAQRVEDECKINYQLSLPYTYLAFQFRNDAMLGIYPFVTRAPLSTYGTNTKVHRLPLPNIYNNGTMCVGDGLEMNPTRAMCKRVDEGTRHILQASRWNSDLEPRYKDLGVDNLKDWHSKSVDDPNFWTKLTLKDLRFSKNDDSSAKLAVLNTVGQLMRYLLGQDGLIENEAAPDNIYPLIVTQAPVNE